jgi:hypothetical protein
MLAVAAASTVAGPISAFLSIPVVAIVYVVASYLKSQARGGSEAGICRVSAGRL